MAISYAFENKCPDAVRYAQQGYNLELAAKNFYGAGEVATEVARVCIEAGDYDTAEKWYRAGYETGLKEPGISADRKNLWEFRWEHAQARLAARRGNKAEAQKHVEAAKAIIERGGNDQERQFVPYLEGYVAFYGGDYPAALKYFSQGSQNDPFILAMIAQTQEKLGNETAAKDLYRNILGATAHNPPVAYARPLAMKKLGAK
jgi:tetratricopeptide (TPR) repeat protein